MRGSFSSSRMIIFQIFRYACGTRQTYASRTSEITIFLHITIISTSLLEASLLRATSSLQQHSLQRGEVLQMPTFTHAADAGLSFMHGCMLCSLVQVSCLEEQGPDQEMSADGPYT
jgi:hypothetical protein